MSPSSQNNLPEESSTSSNAGLSRQLAEARRLFSLRQYAGCRKIAKEILVVDPSNAAAKGLFDLSSLQLQPGPAKDEIAPPTPARALSAASTIRPHREEGEDAAIAPQFSYLLSPLLGNEPEQATQMPEPESPARPPADNMREHTISALVELLQEKDKTLKDWRDPRFGKTWTESRRGRKEDKAARSRAALPPQSGKKGFISRLLARLFGRANS